MKGIASGLAVALLTGCYTGLDAGNGPGAVSQGEGGDAADDTTDGDSDGGSDDPVDADVIGVSGLRRLTAFEYDSVIRDLLRDEEVEGRLLLPADTFAPFDNAYGSQVASAALIEGADLLASDAVDRLLADPQRRDRVVGCTPTAPGDDACMREFITRFGRRALRRPLDDDEVEAFVHGPNGDDGALDYAMEAGDFYTGVDSFLRTILQDPQFLYVVEIGEPVEGERGVYRLGPYEIATRLSFLLWGTGPDDDLLDLAAADGLAGPAAIREVAEDMLADARAVDRIDRFHAMWLGYEQMPFGGDLAASMRAETRALIERVVFTEGRPWQDLFVLDETFVDATLAEHYGLPAPASAEGAWVRYDMPERRGLLAHGSFLSVGAKDGDTSPTLRGVNLVRRLFCTEIPPPPPNVDTDMPNATALCRADRVAEHDVGGCASCHSQMDPVGLGLENFDQVGRYRTFENDDPDTPGDESTCEIAGAGEVPGVGAFRGPAELGSLAIATGKLDDCTATHLYRYAMGRFELDDRDEAFIDAVLEQSGGDEFVFDDLVLAIVSHEAFRHRREES